MKSKFSKFKHKNRQRGLLGMFYISKTGKTPCDFVNRFTWTKGILQIKSKATYDTKKQALA